MAALTRRELLASAAAGALALRTGAAFARPALPSPARSGIDHIIVAMMENRSFDHLLGWLPGAGGRQAGLVYKDNAGQAFKTYPLAPDFQGCNLHDPSHSFDDGRVQLNDGLCDGWLRAGASDILSSGQHP